MPVPDHCPEKNSLGGNEWHFCVHWNVTNLTKVPLTHPLMSFYWGKGREQASLLSTDPLVQFCHQDQELCKLPCPTSSDTVHSLSQLILG